MIDRKPQTDLGAAAEQARNAVDAVYRSDSRRVFATLIRMVGDFDIAEEALHVRVLFPERIGGSL